MCYNYYIFIIIRGSLRKVNRETAEAFTTPYSERTEQ